MNDFFATGATLGPALQILIGLGAGIALGVVHFATLRRVARLYAEGGAGVPLALQLARLLILGAVLFGLAKIGAPALLAGAIGLLLARHVVVRRLGGLP